MDKSEQSKEYAYLDSVRLLLKEQIAVMERKVSGQESDLTSSGSKMWDELTHVIRDFDDVAALSIYNADIARQEDDYRNTLIRLRNYLSLYRIPYFGRFDFLAGADGVTEKVYVGAHSFFDQKTFEPYIYDWRTPIASMFYDYGIGPASFESPGGTERGEITLKRRYKIRGGKMELLYDTDDTLHDEVLGAALSENTQARLKVIIESIQQEQNRAIRDETPGDFIIFGAAGSGKTSVGLHRFAYLLFRNREKLSTKHFEIISRNAVFSSYISDILPELGEEDARCTLFDDLLYKALPQTIAFEEYYPQIEYALSADAADTRLQGIALKGSIEFLRFINDYFEGFVYTMPQIAYTETVLCSSGEFTKRCNDMRRERPFDAVLAHAKAYAATLLEDYFDLHKKDILNEIWHSDGDFFEDEHEEEYIRRRRDTIQGVLTEINRLNNLNPSAFYIEILKSYTALQPDGQGIYAFTQNALQKDTLYYEDALCIAYIGILFERQNTNLLVRQVLIDEAQDYNAIQHALLQKFYPYATFTVLADPHQSVFPGIGIKTREGLLACYKNCHSATLSRSYRSTGPICALASALSGNAFRDYFNRDGLPPQLLLTADSGTQIAALLNNKDFSAYNTIGILTATSQAASRLHKKVPGAALLVDTASDLPAGTVILPAALSKGLEFDVVIADLEGINDANMLYLLCTRALHELYLVCEGDIPDPLQSLSALWV